VGGILFERVRSYATRRTARKALMVPVEESQHSF
jgi:hypothetical protein